MNILYYIIIYIIGTVFGSFFTLAIYRIPLKKDITHERSFCPNCNHKLVFWDMIPVVSYLLYRGKCRYCGEKIRIRYLLLEVISGFIFLIEYIFLNMTFPYFDISKIIFYISFIFMYITIVIICGIDKEYRKIHLGVLLFGFIAYGIYILYLYITQKTGVYRYGIYLVLMSVLCILYTTFLKLKAERKYILEVLMFLVYLTAVLGLELMLVVIALTLVLIGINQLLLYIRKVLKDKPDILQENFIPKVRIGFFLGVSSIIIKIIETYLEYH
ncbi:MAG: prepilin peptidase [Clostridia bacterium]|nr:prepilin peptidase [Clostridia bacterium]